jgi:hypothetical protein
MRKVFHIIVLLFCSLAAFAQRHDQPNNLILSYGIDKNVADDLNSVFGGLGHEFFPLPFMGLQVDGKIGRIRDNTSLSEIKNDIINISSFRISGTYTILSATPRLYLTLNDEDDYYLALFLEYSVGAWRMWGDGRFRDPDGNSYSGLGDTRFQYFQGMALGVRARLSHRVSSMLSLGGNNIDYNRYINSIQFGTPNEIERPGLRGALIIGVGLSISMWPEKKKH